MGKNIIIPTHIFAFILAITTSSFSQAQPKWIFETPLPITANPVAEDGIIYITNSGSTYPVNIFAIDSNAGEAIYKGRTLCHQQWSLAVSHGVLYFGNDSQHFFALDARSFKEKWRFKTHGFSSNVFTYPVINKETVYFGCVDDGLYAVNIHTGRELWHYKVKLDRYRQPDVYNPPVVYNELIYYAGVDCTLHIINCQTGTEEHNIKTEDNISSIPVIKKKILYLGCRDHNLYAYDTRSYKKMWKYGIGNAVIHGKPTVIDKNIYFATSDGHFNALDITNRKMIWRFKAEGAITSTPTIVDNVAYLGSWDSNLYAIDIKTGKKIWSYKTGGPILSSPLIIDKVIYFGSQDNNLYALKIKN